MYSREKTGINFINWKEKRNKININRIINDKKKFEEKKDENIKLYNDIIKEIENVGDKLIIIKWFYSNKKFIRIRIY